MIHFSFDFMNKICTVGLFPALGVPLPAPDSISFYPNNLCVTALQLQSGVHFKPGAVPLWGCGLRRQKVILLAQDEQPE